MRNLRKLVVAATTVALLISLATPVGAATPKAERAAQLAPHSDNLSNPLADAQAAARQQAFQLVAQGKATPVGPNQVVRLNTSTANAHGSKNGSDRFHHGSIFVPLARQGEDNIWTVLGEFGTQIHASYGGDPGPVHNQIPAPDRHVDNTSIWTSNFTQAYYNKMLFSDKKGDISMRNFYIEQSSNRYTVHGTVEDWVQVPYNEARYGADYCGDIVCATTWRFVQDSVGAWYNKQLAAGKTAAQIDAYLSQYDVWDRYDYDGDGVFNEPDGYIDHFQAIHAGSGEETGGGAQGTDAIWSHRWYVQLTPIGTGGPTVGGSVVPFGGTQVGGSKYWIGDYTVEPEDGGVGVFSHEFGHDLGLPDLYDTSGNTGGAENSTGFWTLYSQGSYGSTGIPKDGIGSKPVDMSALEKIQLGWSNLTIVNPGQKTTVKLGPSFFNTKWAQQILVVLPDKSVAFPLGAPYSGSFQYFSGSGNLLDNTMTRSVSLPAGTPKLSAKVKFDAELDFDYVFLTVNGTPVHTDLSSGTDPNGGNPSLQGITGSSAGLWVDLNADLSAFAGQTVVIGFEYVTDSAVAEGGFFADDIAITGQTLDDAETDPGWTFDGFARVGSSVTQSFFNAYEVEYRTYGGYDSGLKTGPYNFGFLDNANLQDWVEHFPYQDGMLVWYYDESFPDNNVGDHCLDGRCGGLFLPVDAHPKLLLRADGQVWRPRIQSYDSTFGLDATDRICVHRLSVRMCYPSLKANPKFDDSKSYWVAPNPAIGNFGWASVPVPNTGTTIRVRAMGSANQYMLVYVNH